MTPGRRTTGQSDQPSGNEQATRPQAWWRRLRGGWRAWRYPPLVGACTGDFSCGCYDCDDYFHNGGKR